jgi:hypothetical protein
MLLGYEGCAAYGAALSRTMVSVTHHGPDGEFPPGPRWKCLTGSGEPESGHFLILKVLAFEVFEAL